jgi:nitrite reductase/ring-hydroxylating ferredoxin subunit
MAEATSAPQWMPAMAANLLDDQTLRAARVAGHALVFLRTDGAVVAYRDACPHEGYPLSTYGERQDFVIVCNKHLWEFDAASGEHISRIPRPQFNLQRYPVREVAGMLEVDVSAVPLAPPPAA